MINEQKLIKQLVEWCNSLDRNVRVENYTRSTLEEVIAYIESQPPADQWIPCSERLPKQYERVLVTATVMQTVFLKESKVAVDVGYLITEGVNEFILSAAGTRQYVKAWMPLPKPYKED